MHTQKQIYFTILFFNAVNTLLLLHLGKQLVWRLQYYLLV